MLSTVNPSVSKLVNPLKKRTPRLYPVNDNEMGKRIVGDIVIAVEMFIRLCFPLPLGQKGDEDSVTNQEVWAFNQPTILVE